MILPVTKIRLAQPADREPLAGLRTLLWPESPTGVHAAEIDAILSGRFAGSLPLVILVAEAPEGKLAGFLEIGLRSRADGCDPAQPVGYVEGWFVDPGWRAQGVGAALMAAAEEWARKQGCREMASDALMDNAAGQQAHLALGFEVVDRCVNFRKVL
jgi:aminoglycoside 6'-N-acetyltransferase I